MTKRTLGEYLALLLEAHGVRHVFGIPGVHNVEIYRGLPRTGIRHITPRHEQGAGFMADGYARVSGQVGVCFVITGPGLTNIMTAMAQAYADSIPMLVISTVNPLGRLSSGDGWLHEMTDQTAIARQVTASSHMITRAEELPGVVARAFATFAGARPRPVHIDIPTDLLGADASALPPPAVAGRVRPPMADAEAIETAAALLSAARRPVILAGGGARAAGAVLARLAETLDAPVCLTVNARGALAAAHPLAISHSASLPAVRRLIAAADVVLAVGTELGPTDYDAYDAGGFAVPGQLIRIDIDPAQIHRQFPASIGLVGDAGAALAALAARVSSRASGDGAARAEATRIAATAELPEGYGRLREIVETIDRALPGAIMVGDSTQLVYAGNLAFAAGRPNSWFNSATGYGTLGYALPAAIGASLAAIGSGGPARPVVVLVGDGGLQFSVAELASAVDAGVPLIVLAWNNRGYGEIRNFMIARGITPIGVDLATPDLVALARAYGWEASRLERLEGLDAALKAAWADGGRSLIEIDEAMAMA